MSRRWSRASVLAVLIGAGLIPGNGLAYHGQARWTTAYGTFGPSSSLAVTPSGEALFSTGFDHDGDDYDYLTAAHDQDGELRWMRRFDSGSDDFAYESVLSADVETLFVTGQAARDMVTVAYDATTGDERWMARESGPAGTADLARAIEISPTGDQVFITGSSDCTEGFDPEDPPPFDCDLRTVAYDVATGSRLWSTAYDSGAAAEDEGYDIVAVSSDSIIVTGDSCSAGTNDECRIVTTAYDALDGSVLWEHIQDTPGNSRDRGVALTTDGTSVFMAGFIEPLEAEDPAAFAIFAYGVETGALLWTARYQTPEGYSLANDIALGSAGTRLYVTGTAGENTYAVVAYGTGSGAELWRAERSGAGGELFTGTVAVDTGDERVYAGGHDGRIVAYDALDGTLLWTSLPVGANLFDVQASSSGGVLAVGWGDGGGALMTRVEPGCSAGPADGPVSQALHEAGAGSPIPGLRDQLAQLSCDAVEFGL